MRFRNTLPLVLLLLAGCADKLNCDVSQAENARNAIRPRAAEPVAAPAPLPLLATSPYEQRRMEQEQPDNAGNAEDSQFTH